MQKYQIHVWRGKPLYISLSLGKHLNSKNDNVLQILVVEEPEKIGMRVRVNPCAVIQILPWRRFEGDKFPNYSGDDLMVVCYVPIWIRVKLAHGQISRECCNLTWSPKIQYYFKFFVLCTTTVT